MTIEEKPIKPKLGLLKLAQELGNVSKVACAKLYDRVPPFFEQQAMPLVCMLTD